MKNIEETLFETNSFRVASPETPFWYTSGKIGPFFINTHFLYGSEKDAVELLDFINNNKNQGLDFTRELKTRVIDFYHNNGLFKNVIDQFYEMIKTHSLFEECSYIAGGERRDWFFSPIIAHLSQKECLYIFKDLTVYTTQSQIHDLKGEKVCHICDLITQASSFERAWIPALQQIKGQMTVAFSVVDRDQGGMEFLKQNKIEGKAKVTINENFFKNALEKNIITQGQFAMIDHFRKASDDFGKNFIINNPDFIKKSLSDNSIKSKVERCIKDNPYQIIFPAEIKDLING